MSLKTRLKKLEGTPPIRELPELITGPMSELTPERCAEIERETWAKYGLPPLIITWPDDPTDEKVVGK